MEQVTSGPLRYLRGTMVGLSVGLLSVIGHLLGHGQLPVMAILQVLGLALAFGGAVTWRRLQLRTLIPAVISFQLLAHWLLTRLSGPGHTSPLSAPRGLPQLGHRHSGGFPTGADFDPAALPTAADSMIQFDLPMIAGHVVAGVVIVAMVWRVDAALYSLASALTRTSSVLRGDRFWLAPMPAAETTPTSPVTPPLAHAQRLCHLPAWLLRGPPSLAVSF